MGEPIVVFPPSPAGN